jgi:hypothetical protein
LCAACATTGAPPPDVAPTGPGIQSTHVGGHDYYWKSGALLQEGESCSAVMQSAVADDARAAAEMQRCRDDQVIGYSVLFGSIGVGGVGAALTSNSSHTTAIVFAGLGIAGAIVGAIVLDRADDAFDRAIDAYNGSASGTQASRGVRLELSASGIGLRF